MKNIKSWIFGIALFSVFQFGQAQSYEVKISPISIEGLGGLQSYAVGNYNGEWLIIGGRLDGLHQRQPFAAFSADGKNQELIVVNPTEKKVWRAQLASLPTTIREQLSSTNMQFYQSENRLLCTGGYGFSPTSDDHITFPYLTIIDISQTISDVKNNTVNASSFHQIENEAFRVSGGALNKIDDVYHLVGGHNFMGRYNPMGPDFGPGFVQEYSDEIRRFKINDDDISVEFLSPFHDEMHLHRRDYNLVPYLSGDERELMVYSGVFKNTVDLPWLYPVSINKDGYQPIEDFTQYFNHYHCAFLPIFDPEYDGMHTLFFGGIAQFYKENDVLVQDNDVPFVNTIAEISRSSSGELKETRLNATMPGYLGAGSVFIFNSDAQLKDNDILDGSIIGDEYQDIGYIYGGIRSTLPNIFWINTGQESEASQTIFKVAIKRAENVSSASEMDDKEYLQFYPNPANRLVRMSIEIEKPADLSITITNAMGTHIHKQVIQKSDLIQGRNHIVLDEVNIGYGAFYYTVNIGNKAITRKVIWTE
ncbi:MAG: hypothetical protein ACJA1A_001843 [Saprospiraceae bacterium]|jgi:hypothetical protein